MSDTVGGGSLFFARDGYEKNGTRKGPQSRSSGQRSIWESMSVTKDVERPAKMVKMENETWFESEETRRAKTEEARPPPTRIGRADTLYEDDAELTTKRHTDDQKSSPSQLLSPLGTASSRLDPEKSTNRPRETPDEENETIPPPAIFRNLTVYINGSTMPTISDHRLKYVLSTHGANISIALGRRTVTHVVVGRPSSSGGSGGGLSGSKIQKEVTRVRGEAVKFVTAEWVLDSVKARKRLPESRYEAMRLAPKGVASVADMFASRKQSDTTSVCDHPP